MPEVVKLLWSIKVSVEINWKIKFRYVILKVITATWIFYALKFFILDDLLISERQSIK